MNPPKRAPGWWLVANFVAMFFGVSHAFLDAFLFLGRGLAVGLAVLLTALLVAWWQAGLRALRTSATAAPLLIAGIWVGALFAFLNGLTILACLPPCGGSFGIADILHIGALLGSVAAVVLTWRFIANRPA